jgi:hypothetical protein
MRTTDISCTEGGGGLAVRRADNLTTFMCRLSINSRSFNLLEPQGIAQACNGIASLKIKKINKTKFTLYYKKPNFALQCTGLKINTITDMRNEILREVLMYSTA